MKRFVFAALLVAFASGGLVSTNAFKTNAAAEPLPTPPAVSTPVPSASKTPIQNVDDPNEVIKIDTDEVTLDVRVVDRNGRPINGLKQHDFTVFEDGAPQEVTSFGQQEVPTNYGLVLDNSGSLRQQLDKVIEAGKVFVNSNRPNDEALIIRFVGRDKIEIVQNFTANKQDLNDALDNLYVEGGQTAIRDAVYLAVENIDDYERSQKPEDRKRRALILVTDGEDRNSYYNDKQLLDLLRESEVQIFVIGFLDDLDKTGGFISKSPRDKAKAFLDSLASETGGKAYYPASAAELPSLASEISSELRTQYKLSYTPSNNKHDGTVRSIKVQVTDGPGGVHRVPVTRNSRTAGAATPISPTRSN